MALSDMSKIEYIDMIDAVGATKILNVMGDQCAGLRGRKEIEMDAGIIECKEGFKK